MLSFFYSAVGFLIAIAILVTVHEFGHYWVAKKLGVKILRFSVGFGKPLWNKVAGEDQTEYCIAAIPLGGYVKMLGEEDDEYSEEEAHRAFNNQRLWKRALIVVAGPAINFLFAIIVYCGLFMTNVESQLPVLGDIPSQSVMAKAGLQSGDRVIAIDGRKVNYLGEHSLYLINKVLKNGHIVVEVQRYGENKRYDISFEGVFMHNPSPSFIAQQIGFQGVARKPFVFSVLEDKPAKTAGILKGDHLLAVNNATVNSAGGFIRLLRENGDQSTELLINREGREQRILIEPKMEEIEGEQIPRIGIQLGLLPLPQEYVVNHQYSLPAAILRSLDETWLMSVVSLRMFGKILLLEASPKNISGPITIAQVAGDALQISIKFFLQILAVISISLGVINLLPIPMLDGGHLLYYAIESIKGSPLGEQWQLIGQKIGLFLLACLMSLAFYNDIFRLLS